MVKLNVEVLDLNVGFSQRMCSASLILSSNLFIYLYQYYSCKVGKLEKLDFYLLCPVPMVYHKSPTIL